MDVAPAAAPSLGHYTIGVFNRDGGYMVRHTFDINAASTTPASPVADGTSLVDAVHAASLVSRDSASPAGTPLGRAYGVVQAEKGHFLLQPLSFTLEGDERPLFIDGATKRTWGVDEVSVAHVDPRMLAVVGTESWIDLSESHAGAPIPLPAAH